MDPLGVPLITLPIQMGWEFTIEPFLRWQFGFIDIPDGQLGNDSVWIWTRIWSDGPEPLLTLLLLRETRNNICSCFADIFSIHSGENGTIGYLLGKLLASFAMGTGNPPEVRVWTGNMVWFGFRFVQKPKPLCLAIVVTRTGNKLMALWLGSIRSVVLFYSSCNLYGN
jgi:hypothetical protein